MVLVQSKKSLRSCHVHSQQLEDRQQRQLRRDLLDELALARAAHGVDDAPGVLAERRLVGVDRARGEGRAHDAAHLLVQRRVHADDGLAMDVLHHLLRIFRRERRALGRGKQLRMLRDVVELVLPHDGPVRHAGARIVVPDHRALLAIAPELGVGHALGVGVRIDQVGERARAHGFLQECTKARESSDGRCATSRAQRARQITRA
jgi:hypothetical protein